MRVGIMLVWFGKWPPWMAAFLVSCATNPDVEWLIFSDCGPVAGAPPNVRFLPTTLREIGDLAEKRLGVRPVLEMPFKLCDLRPAYGIIFQDHLKDFAFWGHCDLDIVWGRVRHFLTDDMLASHDIVTTRKHRIAGHLCLYRNVPEVNDLCARNPEFLAILSRPQCCRYDEEILSDLLTKAAEEGRIRVYWPRMLVNFTVEQPDAPSCLPLLRNKFLWEHGRLYNLLRGDREEILYLHFMTWKHMQSCDFAAGDRPESFFISYSHISTSPGRRLALQGRAWLRWQVNRATSWFMSRFTGSHPL